LASNGLHTNGYTLARKIAFEAAGLKPGDRPAGLTVSIGEALMAVHRCYAGVIHPLLGKHQIHGMAHITGGGIGGNLCRIVPDGFSAEIKRGTWDVPPVFGFLQAAGRVAEAEMYRAFNMGVGYILVAPPDSADGILADLERQDERAWRIGRITAGTEKVVLV
jgi:phosphoribosylformylglycinamidine cyclo-ligase